MPREIISDWTTPAGSGFATVMFFDLTIGVAVQRAALGAMWDSLATNILGNDTSVSVRTSGRDLNDATGTIEAVWSESTVQNSVGSGATEPVPDASQVLLQWQTGQIINGRFLRGRTFIPGVDIGICTQGEVDPVFIASIAATAETFENSTAAFGVWHRPVNGAGGVFAAASGVSVWKELAVLRRRRG